MTHLKIYEQNFICRFRYLSKIQQSVNDINSGIKRKMGFGAKYVILLEFVY